MAKRKHANLGFSAVLRCVPHDLAEHWAEIERAQLRKLISIRQREI
jgi:hypothetical protein